MENPTPKAPRVPPGRDSLAAAAAKPTRKAIYNAMADFRDFRGFTPLGSLNYPSPEDRCAGLLSDATCILSFMSAAFEDASELVSAGKTSVLDERTGGVIAGAVEGVATLIDFAKFFLQNPGVE